MAKRQGKRGSRQTGRSANQRSATSGERATRKRPIEQYDHRDKRRVNNPPVGLVTPETDADDSRKTYRYDPHIDPALQFDSGRGTGQATEVERLIEDGLAAETLDTAKAALAALKKRRRPFLNWSGKAERTTFVVPTVSLHVHERIDPRTIIEAVRTRNGQGDGQMRLFEQPSENPPLREAIDFYKHPHDWSNRMIAGDSLLVMNSLLEKEGMAGKVQMVYIDPPYGVEYASNFQPFTNNRTVKDRDDDLTQEPETLRAFRDTWELGLHSYLTYLRDSLWLSRELLSESGSVFVQIGVKNVHCVRAIMDEVFGEANVMAQIIFRKKMMPLSKKPGCESMTDFILWYVKSRIEAEKKIHQLFVRKDVSAVSFRQACVN